ncbi:helix-turn-helix domain-containing protein [Qipengyuania oceanensis]|uniref:Helix-turn-helix domain-containing protein n=1 Tax=Qipengyuania oceanensis TaxID=1463597 RepID=A0A844YDP6_9SPHN|nr:helix-turn-helix domain-containing protein [Qipengyuania oceanensis]MXO63196.1 helix-turn-helix domain-containing protein [Qipengyuania oceanensis]
MSSVAQPERITADYASGAVRIRLMAPAADLRHYLTGYYRTDIADGEIAEDWLPPEEGNIRSGHSAVDRAVIGSGELAEVPRVILSGPTDRVTHSRLGSGTYWGAGLTPAGWARFVGTPADQMANRFLDARETALPASIVKLFDTLIEDDKEFANQGPRIDAGFRAIMGKEPAAERTIRQVHRAILSPDVTSVPPVAAIAGMSPRTFERFCKRHFGFTGGVLIRRQRFLRSLGKFMLDPSMKWISAVDTHYSDQAHFIREFRAIMGMTPSEYAARPHPVVNLAVAVTHSGGGVPHQALFRPEPGGE